LHLRSEHLSRFTRRTTWPSGRLGGLLFGYSFLLASGAVVGSSPIAEVS